MTEKQIIINEGTCPRCGTFTPKIAEFVNDPCVNPIAHVEYCSCKKCRKVWEWTSDSLGTEVVDLKYRIKQMQDTIGSAS
jgi:predicted amidophosphoribosyltransferase